MVTIGALWLAILLSSIAVWVASALFWMVMPHHKSDYAKLPDDDAVRRALTPQGVVPGQYSIPYAVSGKDLQDPETVRRFEEGPVGILTVMPSGAPTMGEQDHTVVRLLSSHQHGRRVHGEPNAGSGCGLPRRVQGRRHGGVARVRHCHGAGRDLVWATVVGNRQRAAGRTRIRTPYRWILRLALAGMRLT